MSEDEAALGRVVSVTGARVLAVRHRRSGGEPGGAPEPGIGTLVKIMTPGSVVFASISRLDIPLPASDSAEVEQCRFEAEFLGEALVNGPDRLAAFQRGVSVYPLLGDDVLATTSDDLAHVYAQPDDGDDRANVAVGTLHQDRTLPAHLLTDDLLGKHFAVLGTTGSGKSCAVALILQAILDRHPEGHVVLLDPHNEYADAFADSAEVLDPDTIQLPYWLLNFEESVEVLIAAEGPEREAEAAILKEAILAAKDRFRGAGREAEPLTVDTPVPYRLGDLSRLLDEAMGKLDKAESSAPYLRLKARLEALRADRRFAFMFPGLVVHDEMKAILSRILRIPVGGKPITIVDLSGVPSEILDVVVSVLARMIFDFALWSERSRALPVLLVCEEAHRYAPQDTGLGFEPTKKAIARIAKEGRKYGVSLCLVSQRPSELAASVLSQCNTIFALRMSNKRDHDFVRGVMPESALGLLDALPSLRNQEAIVVGEGVTVPLRLRFADLPADRRPRGGTAPFSALWRREGESEPFVAEVIDRWRRQER